MLSLSPEPILQGKFSNKISVYSFYLIHENHEKIENLELYSSLATV